VLLLLLHELAERFGDDIDALCDFLAQRTPKDGLNFDKNLLSFTGIVGHNHMRGDNSDLHPGFDWTGLKTHCSLNEV